MELPERRKVCIMGRFHLGQRRLEQAVDLRLLGGGRSDLPQQRLHVFEVLLRR